MTHFEDEEPPVEPSLEWAAIWLSHLGVESAGKKHRQTEGFNFLGIVFIMGRKM